MFAPQTSFAQKARAKSRYQKAIAGLDGASVYKAADFDSPVIEYLKPGTKITATIARARGVGGLGLFYKVKTHTGKIGYVTDIEIVPEFQSGGAKKRVAEKKKNPVFEEATEQQANPDREPVYYTRYIGGGAGLLNFTEKFQGQKFSSSVTMFAFKMSGPGTLFDGPPLDFNFSFSPSAPSYYEKFGRGPASGFFMFSDLVLNLPLMEFKKGIVFYGLGLMATYTRFKPTVSDTTFDSQELRIGAAASLGYSHRFGKYAVRWDSKYYYEATAYLGHWLSFQVEYK